MECYEEAMVDKHTKKWQSVMQDMNSLQENHTYDLVELPKGKRESTKKQMGLQGENWRRRQYT